MTGVQTCALPICGGIGGVDDVVANGPQGILKHYLHLEWLNCPMTMLGGFSGGGGGGGGGGGRSEERRVGKECRSRWSPYH